MPGSQLSGGWKCVLVNYHNMCLLLVTAKESRLLNTGPAGPLLRARRAVLGVGEELSQKPV